MREILTNIVIPLLSAAVGGIVGGYVGYRGALRAQRIEDERRTKVVGRTVLAEMVRNASRALSAASTTLRYEVADSVWREQLPWVANLFTGEWEKLTHLVTAYDSGSQLTNHSLKWNPFELSQTHQMEAKDILLSHAEKDWFKAIEAVAPKILDSNERAKLADEMAKLEKQAAGSRKILELDRKRAG